MSESLDGERPSNPVNVPAMYISAFGVRRLAAALEAVPRHRTPKTGE